MLIERRRECWPSQRQACRNGFVAIGADGGFSFHDLGNAIRKCRTDLGVEITFDKDPSQLKPNKKGMSVAHGVRGTINYPEGGTGSLLYIKSTLTEKDRGDVLAYKREHAVFPHQSTADQWFDESQFESYRRLGRDSIESLLKLSAELTSDPATRMDTVFAAIPEDWSS